MYHTSKSFCIQSAVMNQSFNGHVENMVVYKEQPDPLKKITSNHQIIKNLTVSNLQKHINSTKISI